MINRLAPLAIVILSLSLLPVAPVSAAIPPSGETPQIQGPDAGSPAPAIFAPPAIAPTISYVVVPHDTLAKIGDKFGVSIKEIKTLNHITISYVIRGQVLQIPASKRTLARKAKSARSSKTATLIPFHRQPAPDYHLPASTFASCPTPEPIPEKQAPDVLQPPNASATIPVTQAKAQPTYLDASGPLQAGYDQEVTQPLPPLPQITANGSSRHVTKKSSNSARASNAPAISYSTPAPSPTPAPAPSSKRGLFNFFYTPPPSVVDWGARFTEMARELGNRDLDYNDGWRPPGESHSWAMDCSNTTRYLYRATTGIKLPRTASDQYYYLHLQNKAWDVPQLASGFADCNYLRQNLKPGDLLFWENTYRPDRQPPITHVMIFLGSNARGQWIMAGSQSSRGGEHNRRHGGPDIYVFNPSRACGGYTTWMGFVHHQGRFCAYGRPLEADKSKLAVAAND